MGRIAHTGRQRAFIHLHLPPSARTGHPRADDRRTIEGVLDMLITGCRWQDLPREDGAPTTVRRPPRMPPREASPPHVFPCRGTRAGCPLVPAGELRARLTAAGAGHARTRSAPPAPLHSGLWRGQRQALVAAQSSLLAVEVPAGRQRQAVAQDASVVSGRVYGQATPPRGGVSSSTPSGIAHAFHFLPER